MKTTIEFDGITMTYTGSGLICFKYEPGQTPVIYNCKYIMAPLDTSVFDVPFYIECKDDPSKLHKFCEMKYLGLVDNPHYADTGAMLREMIKKFDGCLIYKSDEGSTLITKKSIFYLGCNKGVLDVLECVLVRMTSCGPCMIRGIAVPPFFRIKASIVPNAWTWPSCYDKNICDLYEQLKDVEP